MKQIPIIRIIAGILLIITGICAGELPPLNLIPVPAEVTLTGGRYLLDAKFTLTIQGPPSPRLGRYATRFLRRLSGRTGLFFPQDFITPAKVSNSAQFIIKYERLGQIILSEDESYRLTVGKDKIELLAPTDVGAMRGLETLLQLLAADAGSYFFPGCKIKDAPRFPWRGLLIDVSRHFEPVEVIKRNLDGMAAVKLNVLHWHLSDDQGFRVESKVWPKLHALGSDDMFYTQVQIREIIEYAADRGIRIVPEFDVPAHATSWLVGYPELASAPGSYAIERYWGIKDPTMNPVREFTYEFLDKFFQEMAMLFPDEYLHIGGDENNGRHWNANQEIQAFLKAKKLKDNHELQRYFNQQVLKILTKYGKKMIGWDEIFQPGLPQNIVIHSWRGYNFLAEAAQKGYMGILSNGYYIDLIQPAEYHYLVDPLPADSKLTDAQKKLILGGEAASWGEIVTYETIDSRIWPRTAAIAERLWSPASVRDVESMYDRLETISLQLEELELTHIKNYEMMLRRLTSSENVAGLRSFVDLVEPVKQYDRHFQGVTYTSYSPYTRIVDAARPESMTARKLRQLVEGYCRTGNRLELDRIQNMLKTWHENHQSVKMIIISAPVLKEIEPLTVAADELFQYGIETVEYLKTDTKPSAKWYEDVAEILRRAKQPAGQVELAVVAPLEQLIQKLRD